MEAPTPAEILDRAYQRALASGELSLITNAEVLNSIDFIVRGSQTNRSGVRVVMACALAVTHNNTLDARKPYTAEALGAGSFSGRRYDEEHLTAFVLAHELPVKPTTAWLTPAWRNLDKVLVPGVIFMGRPKQMYDAVLLLLDAMAVHRVTPQDVLAEIIRQLLMLRDEQRTIIAGYLQGLRATLTNDALPLSAEDIVNLVERHLRSPNSSRLPVLAIAAAYEVASVPLGERLLALESHNAADSQTGSLGDVEITLIDDEAVVTVYEMKQQLVTRNHIDLAVQKLRSARQRPDHYIFVTTEPIDAVVQQYAVGLYAESGIEFVILDCISFVRHFLHLFHRFRLAYLDAYQKLLLNDLAVDEALKHVFFSLRIQAQSARQSSS